MRRARMVLIVFLLLGVAGATAAGQMVLTKNGDLYRVNESRDGLVVTARYSDESVAELEVPQTTGVAASSLQVGVDEASGALFVLWQEDTGSYSSVWLATFIDDAWFGPTLIAGGNGTAAFNPQLMVQRAESVITLPGVDDEEPVKVEVATSFLHLVWWGEAIGDGFGSAYYVAVYIPESGIPELERLRPVILSDLLPYGIGCFDIEDNENLKHPKLFIDPKSGNPHVFATDFENCLFQILELKPVVPENQNLSKRRRHVVVLRNGSVIALRPELPLATAKLAVGAGLSLIMHWDGEGGILNYLELDEEGISQTKSLALGDNLDHEQAVELIRELAN